MSITVADLVAKLGLDDSAFNRGLDQNMSAFSRHTGKAGAAMTKGLTLPILAAGAVSVKMAADFEASMTLIQTQAGGSAKDVKFLSDAVLNMKNVQHGPDELAKSLYHLKSVGMDNTHAMAALTASEHLASVGGSDLETTTNAVASAFKSGIKGAQNFNQTAATINATIGAGNLRLEDYVSAMGTGVMVSAKQAGISLTDVGAAIAMMTSRGIPATRAATALKMTFSAMEAPTAKMAKVMGDIGLKQLDLANAMRTGGLPAAVNLLKDHLQGLSKTAQTADLTKMFGAKSSQAILTLISNTKDYAKVQKQIVDNATSGAFQKAIEAQGKDAAATWHKALADLGKAAVRIGDVLLPAAANIAKAVSKVAGALDELGPAGTTAVVAFAGVLAAAGPVLTIMSKLSMLKMGKTLGGLGGGVPVVVSGGGGAAARAVVGTGPGMRVAGAAGEAAPSAIFATSTASVASSVLKLAGAVGLMVTAAEIIGKLYGDRALKPGAVVPPGERGGAGVYKWSGGVDTTKAGPVAAGTYKDIIQKLTVKMDTASYGEFKKLYGTIQSIQLLAGKGIVLDTKNMGKKTVGDLQNMRDTIMSELHLTAKQAETVIDTATGKHHKYAWSQDTKEATDEVKDTIHRGGAEIAKDQINAGNKAGKGLADGLNHGQGPTKAAAAKLKSGAAGPVNTLPGVFGGRGKGASDSLAKGVGNVGPTKAAAARLSAAAKPNMPDGFPLGASLGQGLVAGMQSTLGSIQNQAGKLADAAAAGIKVTGQIRSPSRVTHSLGLQFAQGLANGMLAGRGNVSAAARGLAFAGIPSVIGGSPAGGSNGRSNGGASFTFGNVSVILPPGDYGDSEDAGSAAADAFMQRTREIARGY